MVPVASTVKLSQPLKSRNNSVLASLQSDRTLSASMRYNFIYLTAVRDFGKEQADHLAKRLKWEIDDLATQQAEWLEASFDLIDSKHKLHWKQVRGISLTVFLDPSLTRYKLTSILATRILSKERADHIIGSPVSDTEAPIKWSVKMLFGAKRLIRRLLGQGRRAGFARKVLWQPTLVRLPKTDDKYCVKVMTPGFGRLGLRITRHD
jgi:hypothetical protein